MYLIAGLGNPGERYVRTRHNTGFMLLDRFASRFGGKFARREARSKVCTLKGEWGQVVLAKPQTYMNSSGKALAKLLGRYPVEFPKLLVICDDFALPLGRIRFRRKGSAGTHNGLRSVVSSLRTEDFPRLRIGVGVEKIPDDWYEFVLSDFDSREQELLDETLRRADEALETWLVHGIDQAMAGYN